MSLQTPESEIESYQRQRIEVLEEIIKVIKRRVDKIFEEVETSAELSQERILDEGLGALRKILRAINL